MTIDTVELSVEDRQVLFLYQIKFSAFEHLFAAGSGDVVFQGKTWLKSDIKHGRIRSSGNPDSQNTSLDIPLDSEVAKLYRITPPSERVSLSIYNYDPGEDDAAVEWKGILASHSFSESKLNFTVQSLRNATLMQGLRKKQSYQCPHQVYGIGCNLARSNYVVAGNVLTVVGNQINVPEFAGFGDGYFAGEQITWSSAQGLINRRLITESNNAGDLTILHTLSDLEIGTQVVAAPSCDKSLVTCRDRFNDNTDNFGGFAFYREKNVLNGSTAF
tara:strand:+ start:11188 stop:12006 length:819 start_codon:yes stop_codon:yes gene_type:complete